MRWWSRYKEYGASIVLQLGHPGNQTTYEITRGLQPIAPSPVVNRVTGIIPKEIDREKIIEVQDTIATAAWRAQTAGFDGTEQHIEADTVVLATGLRPRAKERMTYEGLAPRVVRIGDCVQPRKIYHAFREAWTAVFSF